MPSSENLLIDCGSAQQCAEIAAKQKDAVLLLMVGVLAVIAVSYAVVILKRYPPIKTNDSE